MTKPDIPRILSTAALVVAVGVFAPGCSPRTDSSGLSQADAVPKSSLEIECERELLYLEALLESRRRDHDFPAAVLAEAYELKQSAAELVLDEEYKLALELIDEAIALLREP
jgi:hypothetical protein